MAFKTARGTEEGAVIEMGVSFIRLHGGNNSVVQTERESMIACVVVSASSTKRLWQIIILLWRGRQKIEKREKRALIYFVIFHFSLWFSENHLSFDSEGETIGPGSSPCFSFMLVRSSSDGVSYWYQQQLCTINFH